MKKILLSLLAVGAIFTANAQMAEGAQARIYAYDLDYKTESMAVNGSTVTCYDITFKTNTAATSAYVTLKDAAGNEVAKIDAKSGDSKNWTAEVNVTVLPHDIVAGTYSWEVTASAPAVENFKQISVSDTDVFTFFRSYGVAVDDAPESDYFGRIYVTNNYKGETTSADDNAGINRMTEVGVYTFSPELKPENNASAYTCEIIGDISSGRSPKDITIGPDGMLYMAIHDFVKSGVYIVDPTDFSYKAIFNGTRNESTGQIKDAEGNYVVGNTYAIGVYGTGEDRELYVVDGQDVFTQYAMCNVSRYDIGTATNWETAPTSSVYAWTYNSKPIRIYGNNSNINPGINVAIEPIKTGGYWVAPYYNQTSESYPTLFYANKDNVSEFCYEKVGLTTTGKGGRGALAVFEDNGVVAYSDGENARFLKYIVNEDNSITVDTESVTTYQKTNHGTYSHAFDFDYAGNLYSVSAGCEVMTVYSVPDEMMGENKRTTPAKKSLAIEITTEDIATGLDNIAVDANAPVEYYNMQGVKVENPSNGIFIKKQGNKTTKVVL